MKDKTYRLYIDESGTHKYSNSEAINERYLCLMGVIISAEHNHSFICPKWEELRDIFTEDKDFPAIFHLSDVINRKNGFSKLYNPTTKQDFNEKYLALLEAGEFTLCCVVLDKKLHIERYGTSAMHPYHYCLNVLLERYVKFLISVDGTGDVLAEARGKVEDNLLQSEFLWFYENGTAFLESSAVKKRLTSNKLKIRTKEARICGLELSDMLALPMKFLTLRNFGRLDKLNDNFTKDVLKVVSKKIRCNPYDKSVKGFGIKLI